MMPCNWEGNRRPGITLASCISDLSGLFPYRLRKGDEHLVLMLYSALLLMLESNEGDIPIVVGLVPFLRCVQKVLVTKSWYEL